MELKPYDKFIHPSTYLEAYIFFIKGQTIYKAYLNSFFIVYKVLKILKQSHKSTKVTPLILINFLLKVIF